MHELSAALCEEKPHPAFLALAAEFSDINPKQIATNSRSSSKKKGKLDESQTDLKEFLGQVYISSEQQEELPSSRRIRAMTQCHEEIQLNEFDCSRAKAVSGDQKRS